MAGVALTGKTPGRIGERLARTLGLATLVVALAFLVVGTPAATPAQAQDTDPSAPAEEAPGGELPDDMIGEGGDEEMVDTMLEGEEEILAGEGYAYDPGTRRDPFKSLLVSTELTENQGPRPEGVPGLLIDEIQVTGIFRTEEGYLAQVQTAEMEKSYLIREGEELYDGDVLRISINEIVFKQIVQDPTALKPFREVVKTLEPED